MRRFLLLFVLVLMAVSCKKDEGPKLTVKETMVIYASEGGSASVTFAAKLSWRAESSAEWITVEPSSGSKGDNREISIEVAPNETEQPRMGFVDIILTNNECHKIAITQRTKTITELYYTNDSTDVPTEPANASAFDAGILSNLYDSERECWVIKFEGKMTSIGEDAFKQCDNLKSVIIPESVTTLERGAFYYCINLECVTIGEGVTTIGEGAFSGCSSLASITIPDSVTEIGEGAFWSCKSMESLTIGESVTTIRDNAFAWCECLTNVTIPDSVTTIGGGAFTLCESLTSVTIGKSVAAIGGEAFWSCSNLASVYCKAIAPPVPTTDYFWDAFNLNAEGRKIFVPTESVNAYKSAEYWSDYADSIEGYDF